MDDVTVRGTTSPGGTGSPGRKDVPGGTGSTGGTGGAGGPGGAGAALREDLLDLLRRREVRQRMNEALLREATGESKSTGVIRAYELVQKILQEAGEDTPVEELDLRRFRDRELRAMIARIRRAAAEAPAAELAGNMEEAETAADSAAAPGKSTEAADSAAASGQFTEAGDSHGQPGTA